MTQRLGMTCSTATAARHQPTLNQAFMHALLLTVAAIYLAELTHAYRSCSQHCICRLNVIWLQLPFQQEKVSRQQGVANHLFKARLCCPEMATGFALEVQHHGTAAGPNRPSPPQPHRPLLHFRTQLDNNKNARTCFG